MELTGMAIPSQPPPTKLKVKDKKASPSVAYNAGISQKGKNAPDRRPDPREVEMARQDLLQVSNPDTHRPFSSIEDACERLIPYHVLAEYDLEIMGEKGVHEVLLGLQAWEETLKNKTQQFISALGWQVGLYNTIMRKLREGEMRGEERLMVEQSLLLDEKQKLVNIRAQIEAKEKAEKEAAEAKVKEALAQAERARAEVEARAQAERAEAEAVHLEGDSNMMVKAHFKLEAQSNVGRPTQVAVLAGEPGSNTEDSWDRLDEEDETIEDEDLDDEDLDVWDDGDDDADDEIYGSGDPGGINSHTEFDSNFPTG